MHETLNRRAEHSRAFSHGEDLEQIVKHRIFSLLYHIMDNSFLIIYHASTTGRMLEASREIC